MSRSLSPKGREQYNKMTLELADAYGVASVREEFAVEPSIAQELNDQITESSDFLQQISLIGVDEIKGEKVILGVDGPVTGRIDTSNADREPREAKSLDALGYELFDTQSDVAMTFRDIDVWAKFPNFYEHYTAAVQHRIALDRIMIGWNGTSVAANTNRQTNPLLQDVNKGWMQLVREQMPEQILTGGEVAGKITLGKGGDYENLDSLVYGISGLIPEEFKTNDIVVIVGRNLLRHEKGLYYAAQGRTPSEKEKLNLSLVVETFGGLVTYTCPFFPANGVVVTPLKNLAIYWQTSSWRRFLVDNPKRSRVEDYLSRNEGYVVQQLERFAAIEPANLEILPDKAPTGGGSGD